MIATTIIARASIASLPKGLDPFDVVVDEVDEVADVVVDEVRKVELLDD